MPVITPSLPVFETRARSADTLTRGVGTMRWMVMPVAACLVVGVAPALSSMPASSDQSPKVPPQIPSLAHDFLIPPEGSPRTKLPRAVGVAESTTYKSGTYDVHILAVSTRDGAYPWDEVEARRQVERMDAWFAAETQGAFRFRLAGFRVLPEYPGSLCGVEPAEMHAAPEIRAIQPSAGAVDVLPVIVGLASADCALDGQAWLGRPVAWVSVDSEYPSVAAMVLWHEIGHNLGLGHSASVVPGSFADPWPMGTNPEVVEYGDAADTMGGGGQWYCDYIECVFNTSGLHAHNRNLLRALSPDVISHVPMGSATSAQAVVELVAEESSVPGIQVVYLPWRNRSKFFIEYRPALGNDAHLADDHGPGSGVHVRLVGDTPTKTPPLYPNQGYGLGTVALPVGAAPDVYSSIPIGFRAGQSTLLPDGTRVEVVSLAPDRATVRIVRPVDEAPPTMAVPRIEYQRGACTRYPCTVPVTASKKGKYRIWIAYGTLDDDQWVSSAVVRVNGVETLVDERPAPDGTDEEMAIGPGSDGWGLWRTYGPGTYNVVYTYRDLAGNEGTSTYQLFLPKPKPSRR